MPTHESPALTGGARVATFHLHGTAEGLLCFTIGEDLFTFRRPL